MGVPIRRRNQSVSYRISNRKDTCKLFYPLPFASLIDFQKNDGCAYLRYEAWLRCEKLLPISHLPLPKVIGAKKMPEFFPRPKIGEGMCWHGE